MSQRNNCINHGRNSYYCSCNCSNGCWITPPLGEIVRIIKSKNKSREGHISYLILKLLLGLTTSAPARADLWMFDRVSRVSAFGHLFLAATPGRDLTARSRLLIRMTQLMGKLQKTNCSCHNARSGSIRFTGDYARSFPLTINHSLYSSLAYATKTNIGLDPSVCLHFVGAL